MRLIDVIIYWLGVLASLGAIGLSIRLHLWVTLAVAIACLINSLILRALSVRMNQMARYLSRPNDGP